MSIDALSGPTATLLGAALDAAQLRHRVHATNLANAGVEGYRPLRADFGDELARLREALAGGATPAGLTPPQARISAATDARGAPLDKVELDGEAVEIAANTLHYQALLRGLSRHLSLLSLAINEGKK